MNTDLRDRGVLPVLIPLLAIVATEVVVFSMSRVLLFAGRTPAVVVALGAALAILIGASFIAARPRMGSGAIIGLLSVLLIATIGAGAYAATQPAFYEREAEASKPTIEVAAANLVFDTETLELSPGGATIEFTNEDTQPHNIAIYESEDALDQKLFVGAIIPANGSVTYDVPPIDVGAYYFQCDVHPAMNGEAVVEEGAGGAAHEGAH